MKKLLAILLSMLMLCAMMPFATVSAADEATIVASVETDVLEAGEEFDVLVQLLNNPGVISAKVKLDWDPDVFELVTDWVYDEDLDEDVESNMIEVAKGWSSKYLSFGPLGKCIVNFANGLATKNVTKEDFFTATFRVKDDAVSGEYTIAVVYDPADFFNIDMEDVVFGKQDAVITVNGTEPTPPSCEHEYTYDCDKNCALCGEETRPEAAHEYFNDCETYCMICNQETREASHNVIHADAVEATCTAMGNIEYWYCDVCGAAWLDAECTQNTNLRAVKTPMAEHTYFNDCETYCLVCNEETREASHNVNHVEAKDATCYEDGNIEYWYCDVCGAAWLDAECTLNTNLKSVVIAMAHNNIQHVEAKDATCYENGNIEYWYCADCGQAWLDAECTLNTNLKAVVLAAAHGEIIAVEAKDATCTETGNIAYWYCETCGQAWLDAECTLNTNLQAVKLGATCANTAVHTEAKDANCYEPGNVEYWYCANCDVYYLDAACTVITNAKSVITPIAHNVIHVEAKDATCTENGNIEYWYCDICGSAWLDELCHQNTNLKAVVLAATCANSAEYVAAKDANCYEPGNVEYWYCANCDVYYADAACTIITNAKNVIIPVTHNVIHVEAKDATCTENGNIEYWYCDACGSAWLDELCHMNTNLKAVVLAATCANGAEYVAAKDATCYEPGNVEYWYCANCDVYYADAACTIITNAKNVIIPVTHNVIHVEAKDATCTENGNIEYWYCDACGSAWLDELCHMNTNLKAVVLGATGHDYDDDMDVDCNVCGDIRVVEYEVKTFGGASIKESNDGLSGLAFRFDLTDKISGLAVVEGTKYVADYSNAYVTPDSTGTYKLISMGAYVSNGTQTLNVAVKKIVLEDNYYAIRIINIPEDKMDTEITCTPYFVYENAEGEKITVELDDYTACAADYAG